MTELAFPPGFVWGCATASYQIEGSPTADGAGPSIWHRFAHTPGTTRNGDTGDVTSDHYRRCKEDVELMAELGLTAYRFSISWPRVLPHGTGSVNTAGLDFYDRLVDALLERGIQPFPTLYHWDLPGTLQDRGGWANRDSAEWFAEYASVAFDRLGDRVKDWITLNEPIVIAHAGHVAGVHAPGIRDLWAGLRVAHHLNLAHGRAVTAFRDSGQDGRIGITINLHPVEPASGSQADRNAAQRHEAYFDRLFTQPIFRGSYPDVLQEWFGDAWPEIREGDLEAISGPVDFLGVNYYFRSVVEDAPGEGLLHVRSVDQPGPKTTMGWGIQPEGLGRVLDWVSRELTGELDLYITENGAAFPDVVEGNGEVPDDDRLDYLRRHFAEAHAAIQRGIPLRGYFVWSLMDNFEWALGFSQRFGVVRVDYTTGERTIKRSGRWYGDVIRRNALEVG